MKLSPETLARPRPQQLPLEDYQPELPHMPPPMTANRAKDCKDCQRKPCNWCSDPLGR